MPKFNVEVSFDLTTEIEAEVNNLLNVLDTSGVEDFDDDSYFQSSGVEVSGGNVKFTVEAENEDDADGIAKEMIFDGMEIEDNNGLTWLVDSVETQIDEIEEPMTLDQAKQIVREWLSSALLPEELKEAFLLILDSTATPFDS